MISFQWADQGARNLLQGKAYVIQHIMSGTRPAY